MRPIDGFGTLGRGLGVCILTCLGLGCSESDAIKVSIDFEGGSADQVEVASGNDIRFSLRPDPVGNERLWFQFKVSSPRPIQPWFTVENDGQAHQTNWEVVRPVVSADGSTWIRADEVSIDPPLLSRVIGKILGRKPGFRFRSPVASNELWVAYFYPYSDRDLQGFLDSLQSDPRVQLSNFGRSEDGRTIRRITIEDPPAVAASPRREIWIICREHPGETPASFVLEGAIEALLRQPAGQELLSRFRINVVPMFNVDGVARGNYYRNSRGVDIAQDWGSFKSAEVRSLDEEMRASLAAGRVSLVFDLHSANEPKNHFLLETPEERLPAALRELQRNLIHSADGVHPQLQVTHTIKLWDYPVIAGNFLAANHGVYVFYSESNYSVGADGTVVTPESLRELGAAFMRILATVLVETAADPGGA